MKKGTIVKINAGDNYVAYGVIKDHTKGYGYAVTILVSLAEWPLKVGQTYNIVEAWIERKLTPLELAEAIS